MRRIVVVGMLFILQALVGGCGAVLGLFVGAVFVPIERCANDAECGHFPPCLISTCEDDGRCHGGCPDVGCDDGLECTTNDRCVNCFCVGSDTCPGWQMCTAEGCRPLACESNADCDDGLFCNGTELCEGGLCQAGGPPCGEMETCDTCLEDSDVCFSPCTADEDCDDSDFCTIDRCDGCVCNHEPTCPGECDEEAQECVEP